MKYNTNKQHLIPFIASFSEKKKKEIILEDSYYDANNKMTMTIGRNGNPIPLIHSSENFELKIKTADPISSENITNKNYIIENKIKTAVNRDHDTKYNVFEEKIKTEVIRDKDNYHLNKITTY